MTICIQDAYPDNTLFFLLIFSHHWQTFFVFNAHTKDVIRRIKQKLRIVRHFSVTRVLTIGAALRKLIGLTDLNLCNFARLFTSLAEATGAIVKFLTQALLFQRIPTGCCKRWPFMIHGSLKRFVLALSPLGFVESFLCYWMHRTAYLILTREICYPVLIVWRKLECIERRMIVLSCKIAPMLHLVLIRVLGPQDTLLTAMGCLSMRARGGKPWLLLCIKSFDLWWSKVFLVENVFGIWAQSLLRVCCR